MRSLDQDVGAFLREAMHLQRIYKRVVESSGFLRDDERRLVGGKLVEVMNVLQAACERTVKKGGYSTTSSSGSGSAKRKKNGHANGTTKEAR